MFKTPPFFYDGPVFYKIILWQESINAIKSDISAYSIVGFNVLGFTRLWFSRRWIKTENLILNSVTSGCVGLLFPIEMYCWFCWILYCLLLHCLTMLIFSWLICLWVSSSSVANPHIKNYYRNCPFSEYYSPASLLYSLLW